MPTGPELVFALRICETPGYPIPTAARLTPRFLDRIKSWWIGRSEARLAVVTAAFEAYQDAHRSFPTFYSDDVTEDESEGQEPPKHKNKSRGLTAPVLLARVCALISRTTFTDAQAWQMPLALPSWYLGTLDELEGTPVRFLYESDEAEDDLPPAVEDMDAAEVYAMALETMGREYADRWLASQKERTGADV